MAVMVVIVEFAAVVLLTVMSCGIGTVETNYCIRRFYDTVRKRVIRFVIVF